jgi:hypothetical protein
MPNKTHARDLFVNVNIDAKRKGLDQCSVVLKILKEPPISYHNMFHNQRTIGSSFLKQVRIREPSIPII